MHVTYQGGHDLAEPRVGTGSDGIDDSLREVGIEFVGQWRRCRSRRRRGRRISVSGIVARAGANVQQWSPHLRSSYHGPVSGPMCGEEVEMEERYRMRNENVLSRQVLIDGLLSNLGSESISFLYPIHLGPGQ